MKCVPNSFYGKLACISVGGAQERRKLVYPKEKWTISGLPDLT